MRWRSISPGCVASSKQRTSGFAPSMASATCWKAAARAKMRSNSIRLRLLYWLLGPLIVIGVLGGLATYWLAWIPARNAYDMALANAAWDLSTRLQASGNGLLL